MKTFYVFYISSITGKEKCNIFRSHNLENITKQAKTLYKNKLVRIEEKKEGK